MMKTVKRKRSAGRGRLKKSRLVGGVFLLCAWIFLCPAQAGTIRIGVLLPVTGKLAEIGLSQRKSMHLASEEINAAGGVRGSEIALIIEDTGGNPQAGRNAMARLVKEAGVSAVIGGVSSTVVWAVSEMAEKHGIPFLVTTASADKITEAKRQFVFRLCPPASEHFKPLSSFLDHAGRVRTVAIIHEESPFGRFGADAFSKFCKARSIRVIQRDAYQEGTINYFPVLEHAAQTSPDIMYIVSKSADAALLLKQAEELSVSPKLFLGHARGITWPAFYENAGRNGLYVCSTTPWAPSVPYRGARRFYERFVETGAGDHIDYRGAQAYASVYVISDACQRAASTKAEDVRKALAKTDLTTAYGPVKFVSYGKKTNQNKLPCLVVQWQRGSLETVWPRGISSARYIFPSPQWSAR